MDDVHFKRGKLGNSTFGECHHCQRRQVSSYVAQPKRLELYMKIADYIVGYIPTRSDTKFMINSFNHSMSFSTTQRVWVGVRKPLFHIRVALRF